MTNESIFVFCLHHDTVSISDYVSSSDRTVGEEWIEKGLEGSRCDVSKYNPSICKERLRKSTITKEDSLYPSQELNQTPHN
jgi:hypothetical protein